MGSVHFSDWVNTVNGQDEGVKKVFLVLDSVAVAEDELVKMALESRVCSATFCPQLSFHLGPKPFNAVGVTGRVIWVHEPNPDRRGERDHRRPRTTRSSQVNRR